MDGPLESLRGVGKDGIYRPLYDYVYVSSRILQKSLVARTGVGTKLETSSKEGRGTYLKRVRGEGGDSDFGRVPCSISTSHTRAFRLFKINLVPRR